MSEDQGPAGAAPSAAAARSGGALWRLAVVLSGVTGAGTLVAAFAGLAWIHAKIPPAPTYANLGVAMLDLGITWGLARRARVAWAFALSIWGTLLIVNLLATPRLLEAGSVGQVSLGFAILRLVTGIILIARRRAVG